MEDLYTPNINSPITAVYLARRTRNTSLPVIYDEIFEWPEAITQNPGQYDRFCQAKINPSIYSNQIRAEKENSFLQEIPCSELRNINPHSLAPRSFAPHIFSLIVFNNRIDPVVAAKKRRQHDCRLNHLFVRYKMFPVEGDNHPVFITRRTAQSFRIPCKRSFFHNSFWSFSHDAIYRRSYTRHFITAHFSTYVWVPND